MRGGKGGSKNKEEGEGEEKKVQAKTNYAFCLECPSRI